MRTGVTAATLAAALLSGCGGGGSPAPAVPEEPEGPVVPEEPGGPATPGTEASTFRLMEQDYALIAGGLGGVLPPEDRPTAGQAVYDGIWRGRLWGGGQGSARIDGEISLVADFALDSFGGRIDGLRRIDDTPLSGQLEIRQGSIGRGAGPALDAVVEGVFTDRSGGLDVFGILTGDFLGAGAAGVGGETVAGVESRFGPMSLAGRFVAE